jgi:hypothetical protein
LYLNGNMDEATRPAPSDNLPALAADLAPRSPGIRTYLLLVFAMALVTILVTGLSLLLIRHELREEVSENLSQDLTHSVTAFEDMQGERISALDRENALLANLPTLKALMTSRDDLTIQDGAVEFWNTSGNDLFALADSSGRVIADYTRGSSSDAALRQGLSSLLTTPGKHYLIDGNSLYACSVRPLYFGSEETGTLLGYVISGASIERTVRQISSPTGAEAAFLSSPTSFANRGYFSANPALLPLSSLEARTTSPPHRTYPPRQPRPCNLSCSSPLPRLSVLSTTSIT